MELLFKRLGFWVDKAAILAYRRLHTYAKQPIARRVAIVHCDRFLSRSKYRLPQLAEALQPGRAVRVHYAPPVHPEGFGRDQGEFCSFSATT
jgi:hypothetical protein